jgi:hypothetical protein
LNKFWSVGNSQNQEVSAPNNTGNGIQQQCAMYQEMNLQITVSIDAAAKKSIVEDGK